MVCENDAVSDVASVCLFELRLHLYITFNDVNTDESKSTDYKDYICLLIQCSAGQLLYHPLQQLQLYSTLRSLNAKYNKS